MNKKIFLVLAVCCIIPLTAIAKVCLLPIADLCDTEVTTKTLEDEKVSPMCPPKYDLLEPLKPENEDQFCSCSKCTDTAGTHYSCKCGQRTTCLEMGYEYEPKPDDEKFTYECEARFSDDYGRTCYDCMKKCKNECKECAELPNPDTCECEKIPETCANLCFKFKFTNYQPISREECEETKEQLGLRFCTDKEKDYLAGAVKTCGGMSEIPTEEEAFKLAQCMYNPNETYSTIYGSRYDGFFESYGGKGKDLADHVYVWLNWERDKDKEYNAFFNGDAIIRMYDFRGSIPYFANRDGSLYYENTGLSPRNWYNDSILSRTLCRVH